MPIHVIDTIEPKNSGSFPIVKTEHIHHNGHRLDEFLGLEKPGTAAIDHTLKKTGQAADAKVTGDIFSSIDLDLNIVQGTATQWGVYADKARYVTKDILCLPFDIVLKSTPDQNRMSVHTFTDANGGGYQDLGWVTDNGDYTVAAGTYFRILIMAATYEIQNTLYINQFRCYDTDLYKSIVIHPAGNESINLVRTARTNARIVSSNSQKDTNISDAISYKLRSINHRGYNTEAPENTLPAYELSRTKGFHFVETDVRWTSDNKPVLLHDASINRTARNADGSEISETVNIADITYAQALTYDFGIRMGQAYAGTKIPTFEEFISLCRSHRLHPYIEVEDALTAEKVQTLLSIVKKYGMLDYVTWISFTHSTLLEIVTQYPRARIGYNRSGGEVIKNVFFQLMRLKTDYNEVFLNFLCSSADLPYYIAEAKAWDVPVEVWCPETEEEILALDPYISGITTNALIASDVIGGFSDTNEAGVGIEKIEKTSTSGLVDTYTITYTDGSTSTYTVTNGKDGTNGSDGINGADGQDGKSAYQSYLDNGGTLSEAEWVASLAQGAPEFVDSVEDMVDTSKVYVNTDDGTIWVYGEVTYTKTSTNQVFVSKDANGNIYNGKGYKYGYRFNTASVETVETYSLISGFIPYSGEVIRFQVDHNNVSFSSNYVKLFDESFAPLMTTDSVRGGFVWWNQRGATKELIDGRIRITIDPETITDDTALGLLSQAKYVAVSGGTAVTDDTNAHYFIVTLDEPIGESTTVTEYLWRSTGMTYAPADYEPRVIALENTVAEQETRLDAIEAGNTATSSIPSYWLTHLEEKADKICLAMEKAGRGKSAFLWYTDAHWINGNSKMSPKLLNYLIRRTPMNKVNFGGDIIGDVLKATRAEMTYLYEWRTAIKDLPNHHSVIGNHDNFSNDTADYEDDNFRYSFLIAPEESHDMVMGGNFYYYIDNPCEKTRYLYLSSGKYSILDDECKFIIDALMSVPNGWHIVAISHIWFQYTATSAPTVGNMNAYAQKALNLFDAYNARQSGSITMANVAKTYNFANCGGKVEFCIGGHIHYQHTLASTGGIPVILTPPDANQVRGGDTYTIGTTTEASVCGVVADYANNKVSLIFVGRGTDTEITL